MWGEEPMKLKITRTTVAYAAIFVFFVLLYFIGNTAQILGIWFIGGWVVYFGDWDWDKENSNVLFPAVLLFIIANGMWFSRERQDQFLQGKLDEIEEICSKSEFDLCEQISEVVSRDPPEDDYADDEPVGLR